MRQWSTVFASPENQEVLNPLTSRAGFVRFDCWSRDPGYQDSGADIAYVLRNDCNINVVTPSSATDPSKDIGWCFPDTEERIKDAIDRGATHLWANTILFASHPLQASPYRAKYKDKVWVVGQPPLLVEKFDDKEFVNNRPRANGSFAMPRGWTVSLSTDTRSSL